MTQATDWEVQKVFPDPYRFTTKSGHDLVKYRLFITDGHDEKLVEWTRQEGSDAPKEGETVHGYYQPDGEYKSGRPRLKFSVARPENGASYTQREPRDPIPSLDPHPAEVQRALARQSSQDTRSARIERQHSQEMALRFLALADPKTGGYGVEDVKRLTDHFVKDLDNLPPHGSQQNREETSDFPRTCCLGGWGWRFRRAGPAPWANRVRAGPPGHSRERAVRPVRRRRHPVLMGALAIVSVILVAALWLITMYALARAADQEYEVYADEYDNY